MHLISQLVLCYLHVISIYNLANSLFGFWVKVRQKNMLSTVSLFHDTCEYVTLHDKGDFLCIRTLRWNLLNYQLVPNSSYQCLKAETFSLVCSQGRCDYRRPEWYDQRRKRIFPQGFRREHRPTVPLIVANEDHI